MIGAPQHGRAAGTTGSEIELESLTGKKRPQSQLVSLAPPDLRSAFVRKVFGILAAQLMTTTVLAGAIVLHGRHWFKANPALVLAAATASGVISLVVACASSCFPEIMRRTPQNYILLAVFTLAKSFMVGLVCLQYSAGSVVMCFCLTAFIVGGLMMYAMSTDRDLTGAGPYLFCALLGMCGLGFLLTIVAAFGGAHTAMFGVLQTLHAGAGALLFSFFIVYDVQMILGGKHEREFGIDDYAMAAMALYIDMIQLFITLLRLLGSRDDNGV